MAASVKNPSTAAHGIHVHSVIKWPLAAAEAEAIPMKEAGHLCCPLGHWSYMCDCACERERERERVRRGGVHPHSLYPYLTVNPPVSLVLLLLLAHCVSRIPSLRALTHSTLLPFSRSAAPDALKKNVILNGELVEGETCWAIRQSLAWFVQQQLGVLRLWSVREAGFCSAGPHTLPPSCRGSMSSRCAVWLCVTLVS